MGNEDTLLQQQIHDAQEDELVLTIEGENSQEFEDASDKDLLKVPKGALVQIYDKLENLEDSIDTIESRQIKDRQKFQNELEELEERQGELDKETKILTSRANHISEFVDDIEEQVSQLGDKVETNQEEMDRRLTLLEEGEQAQGKDDMKDQTEIASGSRLARLSRLDDETLQSEFSVDIQRSIKIYRNFDEWSSRTSAGKRIKSGELKKLLSAKMDDEIAWTQLYRAMKAFEANTASDYELIETKTIGKALIKWV